MNPSGIRFTTTHGKHRSLAQSVAEAIGQGIRDALLKPGAKLPTEAALMEAYGVSRTVVREALSNLQAAGLVRTRHGIGTFVVEPTRARLGFDVDSIVTVHDVLAILELRISLETEAACLAATRRTPAQLAGLAGALADMRTALEQGEPSTDADMHFHRLVAEATQNDYIAWVLTGIGQALIPRRRLNTPSLGAEHPAVYMERMNREHDDIYKAIERQEPDAARAAMRLHLSNSRARLRDVQRRLENVADGGN